MHLPCPSALAFTTLVLAAALAPLAATAADAAADAAQAQGAPEAAVAAPAAPAASAAAPAGRCVSVDVHNVRPQQGQLFLAAYGSAETYNKKPLASARVPAGDAITRVQLCGIGGHEFAVTLYQDLDGDGKMAKNMLGLPTEPWGSTGKPGMFGPSWETGKVTLNGNPVIATLSQ